MHYDVVIVGGGTVGLTLALALAKQASLHIAILEAAAKPSHLTDNNRPYHHRVSAITLSSQRILQSLGAWKNIDEVRISPFTDIKVWEAGTQAEIQFASTEIAELCLGYIVENNVLQAALLDKVIANPQIAYVDSCQLTAIGITESAVMLTTSDKTFNANLAVAADGARSWLRQAAEIVVDHVDYAETAIVATVTTALPHAKTARQIFLPTGPLAFLPLAEAHASSIVWTLPVAEADALMKLNEAEFILRLESAFEKRLGDITTIGQRYSLPLYKQQAKQYVKERIALVGDAAHTVHPLAGQGINIGLLDAASLAEVIAEAYDKQRDFASYSTLRRYERWRKADNLPLIRGIDLIKQLFANDTKTLQQFRAMGLNTIDKWIPLKNIFTHHAVGHRPTLPKLALL